MARGRGGEVQIDLVSGRICRPKGEVGFDVFITRSTARSPGRMAVLPSGRHFRMHRAGPRQFCNAGRSAKQPELQIVLDALMDPQRRVLWGQSELM